MRGGARNTSGPAATIGGKNMQRSADEWRKIPRRDGIGIDIPDWPIGVKEPSEGEWEMWEHLWLHQAQAILWEEDGLAPTVAQYVRIYVTSMQGRLSAQHGTLAKQLREELLLSPAALRAAKIAIMGSEEADALDSITGEKAKAYDESAEAQPRNRLRAVESA